MEKFTFTVGKLDAGMAILIGERAHLIEFPSILLPPGVSSGSIVNISVNRNQAAEKAHLSEFWALQDQILNEYGIDTPQAPQLKLRHVTQTSATLEWPKIELAKADLRALEIYKNGQRLALIPNPKSNTSTKLSSLQSNEEYTFQLVLKTTAGTFPSNIIKVRTHTMNDTSGISVCFGSIQDDNLLAHAKAALKQMNAKWTESIEIDTTHFVCQSAGPAENNYTPSSEYQKAVQLSLPIVQPQWVLACLIDKKLMPVSTFQLGANIPPQYQPRGDAPQEFRQRPKSPKREEPVSQVPLQGRVEEPSSAPPSHSEEEAAKTEEDSASPSTETSGTVVATGGTATASASEPSTVSPLNPMVETTSESQPKSPKPEADGKLDRAFKFPSSSPPADEQAAATGLEAKTGTSTVEEPEEQPKIDTSNSVPEQSFVQTSLEEVSQTAVSELPLSAADIASKDMDHTEDISTAAQPGPVEAEVQPRAPEPKKTDPDVDTAARQWLHGQKPVDASGDSEEAPSSKVLEQVLETKANAEAEKQAAELESSFPSEEPESVEDAPKALPSVSEGGPIIEVPKEHGHVESVGEAQEPFESDAVPEIEVQKNNGNVETIEGDASAPEAVEQAPAEEVEDQAEEPADAEDVNVDDGDETPLDSAAQTPTESPALPDGATSVAGGGKKKKNKKKSKK